MKTVACSICGDFILENFISKHMKFVHTPNTSRKKISQKKEILNSYNHKNTHHIHEKNKLTCILCGVLVERGDLLNHKSIMHGEEIFQNTKGGTKKLNLYAKFVQGGIPGSSKRR